GGLLLLGLAALEGDLDPLILVDDLRGLDPVVADVCDDLRGVGGLVAVAGAGPPYDQGDKESEQQDPQQRPAEIALHIHLSGNPFARSRPSRPASASNHQTGGPAERSLCVRHPGQCPETSTVHRRDAACSTRTRATSPAPTTVQTW